ncbi:BRO-N domain-containing protein [Avibacterium paragallinarum]|uniref:BRO-N domain-containing protein n=1 Tax=Avibacterium paragallinarum TaxID=728 RepID=UPI00102A10AB|nr:BRO family protein [Avibacterium paragallinarum]RZN51766.1 hypothetical protein EIG78_12800 [Avibacterium paragallinarum]
MSNQLFNFNSSPVRIEIFDNQPFFCLLDVCRIFQIQNSRRVQSQMLDPQGVRLAYALAKDEKQRKTAFINEPNLYRIIFRSEKPIAKSFQNWVFEEVLPQIRKTGKYSLQNQQLALPEPEPMLQVPMTEKELNQLINVWFLFTRFAESVQHFLNKVRDLLNINLYQHADNDLHRCNKAIQDTKPLIKRLIQLHQKHKNKSTARLHYHGDF